MLLLLAAARGWRGGWIVASLFDYVPRYYWGPISRLFWLWFNSPCSVFRISIFISCRIARRNQYTLMARPTRTLRLLLTPPWVAHSRQRSMIKSITRVVTTIFTVVATG